MTAGARCRPPKVLVSGAGVAEPRRPASGAGLGAIVRAFDTRAEVRSSAENGAGFLEGEPPRKTDPASAVREGEEPGVSPPRWRVPQPGGDVDIIITNRSFRARTAPHPHHRGGEWCWRRCDGRSRTT